MQTTIDTGLGDTRLAEFQRDGFLVARGLASAARCDALHEEIDRCLDPPLGPLELEAELGYPGAPASVDETGGRTPRRLLHAYSRGPLFRDWAREPVVTRAVSALMGGGPVALVQAHHNCIMTKYPQYGSQTGWHQDIRYWSFASPVLVNAWLALGPEASEQGGLQVVPGSHREVFAIDRFDEALFFRPDLAANRELLDRAVDVELSRGDVLFFHCRLLHAAGRNQSSRVKRSLVFTYNRRDNPPVAGSRSARLAQIPL
ncbi:MAG: phytanoyl-CoA dioxygenase family protein [Gammaproteobacteria bacterium]|nr:phytanoyl-CoA dioxygenase family protein [Gammaproteobacteria bacterium]